MTRDSNGFIPQGAGARPCATGQNGFTLIEVLMVIVIIGVLARLALPRFAAAKEKAYVARMMNDLRNLAVSEEAYFNDAATYYGGSIPAPGLVFAPSTGVTIVVRAASSTGWSATATSVGTGLSCAVSYGTAAPIPGATLQGQINCPP